MDRTDIIKSIKTGIKETESNILLKLKCFDYCKIKKTDTVYYLPSKIIIITKSRILGKKKKHIIPLENIERITYNLSKDYKPDSKTYQYKGMSISDISERIAKENYLNLKTNGTDKLKDNIKKQGIKSISDDIIKKKEDEEDKQSFDFKRLNEEELKELVDLMEAKNLNNNIDCVKNKKFKKDDLAMKIINDLDD